MGIEARPISTAEPREAIPCRAGRPMPARIRPAKPAQEIDPEAPGTVVARALATWRRTVEVERALETCRPIVVARTVPAAARCRILQRTGALSAARPPERAVVKPAPAVRGAHPAWAVLAAVGVVRLVAAVVVAEAEVVVAVGGGDKRGFIRSK